MKPDAGALTIGDASPSARFGAREDAGVTSIGRRVNAERLVLFGWSRAILLQFAHPLIAAGVHEHSGFRASPLAALSRLHHTVGAMLALTFGDSSERTSTIEAIRAIHRRVHGHLAMDAGIFPQGTRYSAEDSDLVLWVHVTLLDSVPLIYETLVTPLSDDERDAYCAEAADVAIELGARPQEIPRTWAAARACLQSMYASNALAVTPQARELADALIDPSFSLLVYPAQWANRVLTVGLLPPEIRDQYGFRWTARDERGLALAVETIRRLRRWAPDAVASWSAARRA